jgi:hypothetical protein
MDYSAILAALRQASAFDLYRLRWAIDRQLDDPRWIVAVHTRVHRGQPVTFYDPRDNALRQGVVNELRRKHVVLQMADGHRVLVEYASINLDGVDAQIREQPKQGLGRHEVRVGDVVGFQDRHGHPHQGTIIRLNDKTVTLQSETQQWRVGYTLLHRLIDGDVSSNFIGGK